MAELSVFNCVSYFVFIVLSCLPLFLSQINTKSVDLPDEHIQQSPAKIKRALDFFGGWAPENKGYAKLEWRHCGSKGDDIILQNIKLNPNPINVPGKVFVSFEMEVKENQSAPIKLRVDMKKKVPVLFGIETWIPVPCYPNGLGSCSIEDICDMAKLNLVSCPMAFHQWNRKCLLLHPIWIHSCYETTANINLH